MNAVGIDVSKGKSMVAIMRPLGEVVAMPFEVGHTATELNELANFILKIDGETRVVMEYTGVYFEPVAKALFDAGLRVCVVHPQLIHNFDNNTIRKVKTDKADSIKIANYALSNWDKLKLYTPVDEVRRQLKAFSRQYRKFNKLKTMLKNNLIALTESTFPGVNELFTSPPRKSDGHEKWLDFIMKFWHAECICSLTKKAFTERYKKWCHKEGYHFSKRKAEEIYSASLGHIGLLPKDEHTKQLLQQTIIQITSICSALSVIENKMSELASMLPEYPVAMAFNGVGRILGPQIIAEVGDVSRFARKESLVCFAGLEAPPYESGKFESHNRTISKKGSPQLRAALFQVMNCLIQTQPKDDVVYQFIDRKRSEGKHYYSYMCAGCAKFLRIYYARVKEYLAALEQNT